MAIIACPNPTTVSGQCPTYPDMALSVTPSDTDTFGYPVFIQVSGAGNVSVVPWASTTGTAITVGLPVGGATQFRVQAVKATGTTASGIVAIY